MHLTLKEIAAATNGSLHGADAVITAVSTDSRTIPPHALYIAIRGDTFDGHDFCAKAAEKGAAALICEKTPETNLPYILVKSTRRALLDVAQLHRSKHTNVKVVGLTGSVGKTTTKEMIFAVLETAFAAIKTEGNLNNEIGMPKTLLRLDASTQAAVIEMGMNHFGEIARMTRACRPDIGVITNIGVSHIEYLGSRDGILQAKTELLEGMQAGSPLLLNGDDDKLSAYQNPNFSVRYFGIENPNVWVRATQIRTENGETRFTVVFPNGAQAVCLPCVGKHNVYNALAAFGVGLCLEIPPERIAQGLQNYRPAGMRQRIRTVRGITVIEDCYNASPDSQKAALQVLGSLPAARKIAVLGDMLELGDYAAEAHKTVGRYAVEQHLDLLYCYGALATHIAAAAQDAVQTLCFTDKAELTRALLQTLQDGDAVLFKASRGMALEEVIENLYKEWERE